ncbi:MAG: response regulator transcription factor [Anaerolineae bacterium]|uniref:response regulator transcription factor n=1 Tax=Candidatus Amarolinea dominans TaxID=3140696 RepID=UPI001E088089|nr:response regulator transcription factor [Anaerolineae bacterium]MBK7202599.1 response regulator transcription factor [Anaerolineae bacterium]MBK9094502.1 response regulator transcription factor [Anaerolineae bacterium]MBK9232967.1 response regulator transcription factor [Anaerolineae bacterium]
MPQTILVVDDETRLRTMLRVYLEQEGYRVVEAGHGREALYVARYEKPDLIILDLMMPEMGGYEFMRVFSREASTPVIMLTAKVEDTDKILGLELGADDYVTKPFNVRELLARVHAVLRRLQKAQAEPDILRVADVTLDRSACTVKVAERFVDLTPSEFGLLAALMASPGRVFSRLDLLDLVSGDAYEGYERTIDVHVRNLRTKIEPDPRRPKYVETVYGMGYRFAPERPPGPTDDKPLE